MRTNVFSCGPRFCSSLYRAPARLVALAGLFAFAFAVPASCGPIHDAARKGDLAQVQALLKGDPTLISSKDELGKTPLAMAAVAGQKDVVEFLLAHGADVNARDIVGDTPLHNADWEDDEGHKDVVGLLLAHGADVNAKGQQGRTPLHDAAFDGSTGMTTLLLAKGADVKARDDLGDTPLHFAAMSGPGVVNLLLANGADVNAQNIAGTTPLMMAALLAQESAAEVLLAHGADVNAKDKIGNTALAYVNSPAAKGDAKSKQAVVDLLRQLEPLLSVAALSERLRVHSIFFAAVRVSGLLARAGYARRRDQRERHKEDGSGNVCQVAVAQVFGDEFDRDQRQDCVAQPGQFHATPMRAAKRKRQSCRAQSQRADERQMMRAGNHLQRDERNQSLHDQRRCRTRGQSGKSKMKSLRLPAFTFPEASQPRSRESRKP